MSPALKYDHIELTGTETETIECEAHYEAIDPAHLDDPYAQKTLIGPSVVTGEIRFHHPVGKVIWPDMEV